MNEFNAHCLKCGVNCDPVDKTGKVLRNGTISIKGKCPTCGGTVTTMSARPKAEAAGIGIVRIGESDGRRTDQDFQGR